MNTKKLVLSALMVAMVSGSAAFAGPGGNGNGNGKGASRNDNGRNSNGVIASELKWRNAAHASAQAFENADPESAVGLLAALTSAYDEAGVELGAEARSIEEIQALLGDFDETPRGSGVIQAEIDDAPEGTDVSELETEKLVALAYEALVVELALAEDLAEAGVAEAKEAIGFDELTNPETIAALWSLLEGK